MPILNLGRVVGRDATVQAGTGLTKTGDTVSVEFGATAGTVAEGDDLRLSDAREWVASVVTQAEAEAGTATTARKWTAQRVRQAVVAWWNTISGTVVEQSDIGTNPNQLPLNQYLGDIAFQNATAFVIKPAVSANPHQVGSMVFQLTNDTTLVIKVKGADGIVRSATLALT